MDELWKDVDNTSGRYQISSNGRLRQRDKTEYKLINPHLDSYGYQYVTIKFNNNKNPRHVAIHRLVAQAFINNPYNLPVVHHIDDNKLNNTVSNLFWCTHGQNHSFSLSARNGTIQKHRVIEQYTLDGEYIATWNSFIEAYRAIKPNNNSNCTSLISYCCQGKKGRKTAYGYIWRFGKGDPMYEPDIEELDYSIEDLFNIACEKSAEKVRRALINIISE